MIRLLFAALHLLALGIGLGAIWTRGRTLRGALDPAALRRVFYADMWWGIAALLWITTGLIRVLASMENSATYYATSHLFWTKMGLLALILALEVRPMVTLIRWRGQLARGNTPDTSAAGSLGTISFLQALFVAIMVLVAAAMARGYGA